MSYRHLIFTNQEQGLENIPFHLPAEKITRLAPQGFPLHTAIHCISGVESLPDPYVNPHQHDVAEINIFIPTSSDFVFDVQLGDSHYQIKEHTSIWVPPNLIHAANIQQGSGYFICVILEATPQINWR